jgi:hypothetical protein
VVAVAEMESLGPDARVALDAEETEKGKKGARPEKTVWKTVG